MAQEGFGTARWRKYEDYKSLKKYINSGLGQYWDIDHTNEIHMHGCMVTTGTSAELVSLQNGAVGNIGKTELTILGALSDNDGSYDGAICTLIYKSNDGVTHIATSTVAADNTTEVAFTKTCSTNGYACGCTDGDAVEDYYCSVSATMDTAVPAGDTYGYGATGALTVAAGGGILEATETEATQANMGGVGSVYGRSHTDDGGGVADGSVYTMDYMTPWGEVKKGATCTLTSSSDDEINFIESDAATYVRDFYRAISLETDTATTADTHEGLLTDAACSNVNGAGGDVYACINELTTSACLSGMTAPEDGVADMWLGKVVLNSSVAALGDDYLCEITITPKGDGTAKIIYLEWSNHLEFDCAIPLEPDSSVKFMVNDTATASEIMFDVYYIVAKRM